MKHDALVHEIAAAAPEFQAHVPLGVYFDEALAVARFVSTHWDATKDRPGLVSIAKHKSREYVVSEHTSDEITWLVERAREANTAMLLAQAPHVSKPDLARALEIVSELDHVLAFHFDDGKDDEHDAALAAVEQAHAHDTTIGGLASELVDYAALATPIRAALHGLGDFDAAMIDEAGPLAAKLREREPHPKSPEAIAAHVERDRTLNVLAVRVDAVRSGARFVYRKHPDIRRLATSGYERSRRLAAKRKAHAAATAPTRP